jgi:tryptophan-rich sensory protein
MARTIALNLLFKTLGLKNVKGAADAIDQLQGKVANFGKKAGIAGGLVAATGAATQLSAALLPVAAAAGALPGAFAAAKAGALTAKVAFMGMSEAMGAMAEGDAKKLNAAMKDLAPSAREVVKESAGIYKTFKDIQQATQQNMFKGVAGPMRDVARNLAPSVKTGMTGVASSMNAAGKEALKFGASPLAKGTVAAVFKTTKTVISAATTAVRPFLAGLATITKLSLPFAQRLGLAAVNGMKVSGAFMSSKKAGEGFTKLVGTGIDRLFQLGRIVKNVAVGLLSMFKGVKADGAGLLTTVENLTTKFAAWSKTAKGQQQVAEAFAFFRDVMKQVAAVAPLVLSPLAVVAKLVTGLPEPVRNAAVNFLALSLVFGPMVGKIFAVTKAILMFKVAQNGATVASKLAAAAMWLFNNAIKGNPIVLVISLLVALGAGLVIAYQKSTTFRNIVQSAWKTIQQAIGYAWNNVIKPAFAALVGFVTNTLAPKIMWFYNNVIKPAWTGISFAIKVAWGIIKIIFAVIVYTVKKVIAPAIVWLWKNVITPAWKAISFAIKVAWGIIKIIFAAIIYAVKKTVAPVIMWLWKNVIAPAFKTIGSIIKTVWNGVVKPIFDKFKTGVGLLATSFKTAVTNIGKFWGKIKDAAKAPIKWVIDTVYTGGIKRVWDNIATKVGASKLPDAPRFARGGQITGPGGTKSDKVPILASRNEYVVNARATRKNLPLLERINRGGGKPARQASAKGLMGDPGGILPGFAGGGLIEGLGKFFASAKDFFLNGAVNAAKFVTNPLLNLGDATIGKTGFGSMIMGSVRKIIDMVLEWIKGKEPKLGGNSTAVKAARSQIGVPYSWGGGGPGGPGYGFAQGAGIKGFDCSSLMQYAWFKASGKVIPRTTYTQKPYLKRISKPVPGAIGQPHSEHTYMYSGNGKIIEAPFTGARVREVGMRNTPFWGLPPFASASSADTGATILRPGMNAVYNGTGKPEPLVSPDMGGNTYNITLINEPGSDAAEAGRKVVAAIKEYERRSGKSWRR